MVRPLRLDEQLGRSEWMLEKVYDNYYAQQLYSALCNNTFCEISNTKNIWSCSWRYAGSLIAKLRDEGDYLDWYASGNEGQITQEVYSDLQKLGWIAVNNENFDSEEWVAAAKDKHRFPIPLRKRVAVPGDFRVALTGEAGAGKNAVSEIIRETYLDAISVAFADSLKMLCSKMVNDFARSNDMNDIFFSQWDIRRIDEHKDLLRPLWQWIGTDLVRNSYPNYWINRLANYLNSNEFARKIIVTDCRFHNEADWLKANGFIIARLNGRNRENVPSHSSEYTSSQLDVDIEYKNNGSLEDLRSWTFDQLMPMAMDKLRQ